MKLAIAQIFFLVACTDAYKHRFRRTSPSVNGKTECPCIGTSDKVEIDASSNAGFPHYNDVHYHENVGKQCGAWDKHVAATDDKPYTGDPTCTSDKASTHWCNKKWCYVDPCTCHLMAKRSSYFPTLKTTGDKLVFYSYATCLASDSYSCSSDDVTQNACPCWAANIATGGGGVCQDTATFGNNTVAKPSYCVNHNGDCKHQDLTTACTHNGETYNNKFL